MELVLIISWPFITWDNNLYPSTLNAGFNTLALFTAFFTTRLGGYIPINPLNKPLNNPLGPPYSDYSSLNNINGNKAKYAFRLYV
jgi:hypothetical protein